MPQDASAIEREAFDRVLILGEPHSGKLAPLDEPVLTPHGWSTMGALRVGDHVIGSDGAATKVIGIYPQGVQKIVRVTADDGASTRCGLEHLWLTTTRHELRSGSRRYPPGTPHRLRGIVKQEFIGWGAGTVKTTEEIMETLRAKHYLPRLSKPVRFIGAEARADLVGASLPIEPYFLGLLLGDGSFVEGSSITFTKPDDELLDAVTRGVTVFGDEGVRTGSDEKCAGIRVRGTGTRDALRALRLYGCRAEAKFVPAIYLTALPEARLLMLRGLLDTDGHAQRQCCDDNPEHPNNGRSLLAEFSTTAPGLRDGVVELVRSLGGRAYVRYKPEPKFQDGGVGQPAWSVMITFDDGTCPFALKRKADVWSADREKHYRQRVETIEAAGETECVCIEVDAADGLYVAKDYLLTHNSTSVTASAAEAFGLGYVINCGKKTGLLDAARRTSKFKFDVVRDHAGMEEALKEARRGAKESLYKWIALDDFNLYASWLEVALEDQTRNAKGEADGRRFWREYRKSLVNILVRLFDMKAHVYVISHYIETGGGLIDGQTEKTGQGVAPMFAGAARKEIPGMFSDIVFMAPSTKDSSKRSFHINPVGVFGPSCLSAPGTREIPADVGVLHEAFKTAPQARGAKR